MEFKNLRHYKIYTHEDNPDCMCDQCLSRYLIGLAQRTGATAEAIAQALQVDLETIQRLLSLKDSSGGKQ